MLGNVGSCHQRLTKVLFLWLEHIHRVLACGLNDLKRTFITSWRQNLGVAVVMVLKTST